MKLSKRLKVIADLVKKNDKIADIGCDHAYLSIYLAEKDLCKKIIATEIVDGPYNIALNNIKKSNLENKIKLYLTNGLINVKDDIDTLVIAGMGATTIINILKDYENLNQVNKMIVQSNNDWEMIRRFLNFNEFYIDKEIYVNENKKDYITFLVYRGNKIHSDEELIIGVYNPSNIELYKKHASKIKDILDKIPNKTDENYQKYKKKLGALNKYIN